MEPTRRQFLGTAAASAIFAPSLLADDTTLKLPTRSFGKTGMVVPVIGFGSGSRFMLYEAEDKALEALNRAINLGITYLDTAHSYGSGKSEERIGQLMPALRNKVILATKIGARKADDARRQIELSLKRLQTDRLDVLHIHALKDEADLATAEAPDGVLKVLYQMRDQKVARAIGITSHASPTALKAALERHDFDCTQMALNAALARMADGQGGMKATRMKEGSFEELALPVARAKQMGIIAMKVFGQDQITHAASTDDLLTYALSLPVSLASLGMPKPEYIERNARVAAAFKPLNDDDRKRLSDSIGAELKVSMRHFFADHLDA